MHHRCMALALMDACCTCASSRFGAAAPPLLLQSTKLSSKKSTSTVSFVCLFCMPTATNSGSIESVRLGDPLGPVQAGCEAPVSIAEAGTAITGAVLGPPSEDPFFRVKSWSGDTVREESLASGSPSSYSATRCCGSCSCCCRHAPLAMPWLPCSCCCCHAPLPTPCCGDGCNTWAIG